MYSPINREKKLPGRIEIDSSREREREAIVSDNTYIIEIKIE